MAVPDVQTTIRCAQDVHKNSRVLQLQNPVRSDNKDVVRPSVATFRVPAFAFSLRTRLLRALACGGRAQPAVASPFTSLTGVV